MHASGYPLVFTLSRTAPAPLTERRQLRRSMVAARADEDNAVLGWISVGGSRDSDASPTTGEVWAIYVDPRHWRRGVGRTLWNHARDTLRDAGFADVTLWVLKENHSALGFYASVGFTAEKGREERIERGGAELVEVRLRLRLT